MTLKDNKQSSDLKSETPEETANVYSPSNVKLKVKIAFMYIGVWFLAILLYSIVISFINQNLRFTLGGLPTAILFAFMLFSASSATKKLKEILISNNEKKATSFKKSKSNTEQRQELKELIKDYNALSDTALDSILSSSVTEEREAAKYILEHRDKNKFCQKCGTEIVDGATFCHKCGKIINKPTPAKIKRAEEFAEKVDKTEEAKEYFRKNRVIYIIAIILTIALIFLFTYHKEPTIEASIDNSSTSSFDDTTYYLCSENIFYHKKGCKKLNGSTIEIKYSKIDVQPPCPTCNPD